MIYENWLPLEEEEKKKKNCTKATYVDSDKK